MRTKKVGAALFMILSCGGFWGSLDAQQSTPRKSSIRIAIVGQSPGLPALEAQLKHAVDLLADNKTDAGGGELRRVLDSSLFELLSPDRQRLAYYLSGLLAFDAKKNKEAHRMFVLSTSFSAAGGEDWWYRLLTAEDSDMRESSLCLLSLAQHWPDKLKAVNNRFVTSVARKMKQEPELVAARWELLDALNRAEWRPPFDEPSYLWRDLALHLVEIGQVDRAKDVARRIVDPSMLIGMRADRRFERIVASDPKHYLIHEAAELHIASLRTVVAENPRSLEAFINLAYALLITLRYDEVLQSTTAAIERARSAPRNAAPFDDIDSQLVWVIDTRARALRGLGRWDEAAQQLVSASQMPENGRSNVSQLINLAILYARMGRNEEARRTIAKVGDNVSTYGKMQVELAKLYAAVTIQDEAETKLTLKYLGEHRQDAEEAYASALVAANRLDEAAHLLIDRLEDPERRFDALLEIQTYRQSPTTPFSETMRERRNSIAKRPDVAAAIAKVGSVESYDIDSAPN